MTRENIFAYLKTIFLTLLTALVLVLALLALIRYQVYEEGNTKAQQDETIDYQLIGVLIDKNRYLETQYPKDYKFNFRLGVLYEIEGDFNSAGAEYKLAIEKVPFGEYRPYYRYALFLLRMNKLDDAENLMDSIDDQPDKLLIEYKGDIFNKLGDKYYNLGDYETAGLKYQKALLYFNAINSDKIRLVKNNLASAYVYLADQKVNEMQIEDAISSLQMALGIVDAPILKYKLALLLMNSNPNSAYQYFQQVYKEEPGIINYGTYTAFLFTLANDAQAKGDVTQAQLYQYQIRMLKEYNRENILSVDDLQFKLVEAKIEMNHWTKKFDSQIELIVKNASKHDIDSLYLEVIFKNKNIVIDDHFKQIVDSKSVLKPNAESPLIILKTEKVEANEDRTPKTITAEIYALKAQDSYKILLQSIEIKQAPKKKYTNKYARIIMEIIDKITAKLPAWLF